MRRKPTHRRKKSPVPIEPEIQYVIRHLKTNVYINSEIYDDEEQEKIQNFIHHAAQEILIDKSYVDFPGTKYKKTFITDYGWENLKFHVLKTISTSKLKYTYVDQDEMLEAFRVIGCCYLYSLLEDLGYDLSAIGIEVLKAPFSVETYADYNPEWISTT